MYRQSAVIPYRQRDDGLEILLITSRKGRRWVPPKGVVEPNLSPPQSAAQEALEEAGIRGMVDEVPLGTYAYEKWGGVCEVEVFAMKVTDELADWPEAAFRKREWMPSLEARDRLTEDGLKTLVEALSDRLRTKQPN